VPRARRDEVAELRRFGLAEAARVIAGEPMRMPLATKGFCGSLGMAFLLTVMCARPASSASCRSRFRAQVEQEHVALGATRNNAQTLEASASAACAR